MFSSTLRLSASVKCWCTMPMPAASAARGIAGRQRPAEDLDGALVGDVMAEEHVHQRGLAGAVLAEERDRLARAERERDAVVGGQRPEALGDAFEAQDDRGRPPGRSFRTTWARRRRSRP
jgi:hypothetical protein